MRSFTGDYPTKPGIRFKKRRNLSRHLQASPNGSVCVDHGVSLVEIGDADLPDSFDVQLRENHELFGCPECYPSDEMELDFDAIAKEIAGNWNHYQQYFRQERRPDIDQTGFEFR